MESLVAVEEDDPSLGLASGTCEPAAEYSCPASLVKELYKRATDFLNAQVEGASGGLTFQTPDPLGMKSPTPADFLMHSYTVRGWAPAEQFPGLCETQCPGCESSARVSARGWEPEARSITCGDRDELLIPRRYVCEGCPAAAAGGADAGVRHFSACDTAVLAALPAAVRLRLPAIVTRRAAVERSLVRRLRRDLAGGKSAREVADSIREAHGERFLELKAAYYDFYARRHKLPSVSGHPTPEVFPTYGDAGYGCALDAQALAEAHAADTAEQQQQQPPSSGGQQLGQQVLQTQQTAAPELSASRRARAQRRKLMREKAGAHPQQPQPQQEQRQQQVQQPQASFQAASAAANAQTVDAISYLLDQQQHQQRLLLATQALVFQSLPGGQAVGEGLALYRPYIQQQQQRQREQASAAPRLEAPRRGGVGVGKKCSTCKRPLKGKSKGVEGSCAC